MTDKDIIKRFNALQDLTYALDRVADNFLQNNDTDNDRLLLYTVNELSKILFDYLRYTKDK